MGKAKFRIFSQVKSVYAVTVVHNSETRAKKNTFPQL